MNNYHIYEEVGRGKYSVVYKGRIKKSIKYVAVKSVERSRRRKLMNEVRIFHDLQHKNVLKFYNWYETRNHLWIIFEYCPTGDLFQLIEVDKKLSEETVKKFAYDLVEGLSYLHSNGIIYSDLKPSNILINEYGVLKYCDFGLSKKITDFQQNAPEVQNDPGKPKAGTPYYMAPELFSDNGVHSFYSDFWSLGCVLFELATGKPPFSTNSLKELINMIVEFDFPKVEGFSAEFNDLLRKLLEKDPTKRINWEELKSHQWWIINGKPNEFTKRFYPPQTQFDQYLKSRGIVPDHFYDQRNNPLVKKIALIAGPAQNKVDILRLSHNVRKNMKREEDEENTNNQYGLQQPNKENYSEQVKGGAMLGQSNYNQAQQLNQPSKIELQQPVEDDDISINNRKMVLNFGGKEEDDESDQNFKQVSGSGSGNVTPNNQGANPTGFSQFDDNPVQLPQQQMKQGAQSQAATNYNMLQSQFEPEDDLQINPQPQTIMQQQKKPQNFQSQQKLAQPSKIIPQQNNLTNQTQLLSTNSNFTVKPQQQAQKDLMMLINQQMFQNPSSQGYNGGAAGSTQSSQMSKADGSAAGSITAQQAAQQMKVPYKSIDQLLMHNSDTAVKPIIGNKEIEKIVETQYDASQLSFEPWSPDLILQKIETPQIENHLNELYNSIAQNTSINEKVNALLYFESIVVNSNVSNRLINSAFMNLLVKMLKTIKTPQIRIRLCSVIGLLIRHSTVIENEVAESDVCMQLIEAMKDKNEKVRRKAIAALGEYMFYAATQLDDEQADACWQIKDEAINCIIKSIREQEDEVVRFYASKTLENITAQSNSAGDRFATAEAANYLLALFLSQTPNENLRTSAAVALSHVCRLQPKLFPLIFNKITPKHFCYNLSEGQSRVQQAFITMLNQALSQNSYPKINEILLNEETFLKSLMKLLEHHSIVIRGKVLLTFLLLFKQDFRWMAIVDPEVKFFHVLDRLSRDNYKYVQCCLLCLIEGILQIIPVVFSAISEELNILLNGGRTSAIPSEFDRKIHRSEFESLQGNLVYIAIILDLLTAQNIKSRLIEYRFIRSIATLIDNCDIYSFQGSEEFLNALLLIVENLSSNQKILLQWTDPILTLMLPVLLQKTKSDSADIRFLSLKIFTDIVIQYLNDDSVYDLKAAEGLPDVDASTMITTKQITELLQTQLFPCFKYILQDNDPVPLFGLKLLSAIVERNPVFVFQMRNYDLFQYIAENYQVNHPRLNRHTMNILKSIIESKQLSFQEMYQYKLIEKSHLIIKNMLANKQDWCTEILLDIIQLLLTQFNEVIKTKEGEISKLIDEIFNNFDICVQLLSLQFEVTIVEKSSQCLILMLQLYALCQQKKREIYFVEGHMNYLISALKTDKKLIQKRVLKCIYWGLIQSEYTIKLPKDKRMILEQQVQVLLQSDDRSIQTTTREIYKILIEQNQQIGSGSALGQGYGELQQQQQYNIMGSGGGARQQMNFYQ